MIRDERKGAMVEHGGSEMVAGRKGLYMEVTEHLIGPPAAEKANTVAVNVTTKQRHCATGAE